MLSLRLKSNFCTFLSGFRLRDFCLIAHEKAYEKTVARHLKITSKLLAGSDSLLPQHDKPENQEPFVWLGILQSFSLPTLEKLNLVFFFS